MPEKPKVAFYWCSSCGGCEESVVDLAEDILGVVEAVDIIFWPVAMDFKKKDVEAMPDGSILATLLNGAIRTSEQEEMARLLRKKSQVMIAYGSFQLIIDQIEALNVLKKIREHMLLAGDLLINIFTPVLQHQGWSKSTTILDHKSKINLVRRQQLDNLNQIATSFCTYELLINGDIKKQEQEIIQVTWYSQAKLELLLKQAGFKLIKIYDDPVPNEDQSKILHVVAV